MPRVPGCEAVYEVANQWRDRCLIGDGSLLWPELNEPTWTIENLRRARDLINELVVQNTNTGGHMELQFREEPEEIKRVVADVTAIWNVCPGSIGIETRKAFVRFVAGWVDSPPLLDDVNEAIQANIGGKESAWFKPGFQIQRGAHLRFILEFGRRLKVDQVDPSSYLAVRSLTRSIQEEYPRSASAANMVLHMLFPDETEPIFNNWARDRIAEAPEFAKLIDESSDFDDALASIRQAYETQSGLRRFDFYDPEIRNIWRPTESLEQLDESSQSDSMADEEIPSEKQYWWVNQGDSYTTERDGGYLWAGRLNRAGRPMWHHETMRELRAGDLIVHYANLHLRAIGRVKEAIQAGERPTTRQPEAGTQEGYRVEVDYRELNPPVKVDELPMAFRLAAIPPFNTRGDVQQVYLVPLEPEWISELFLRFKQSWPAAPGYQPSEIDFQKSTEKAEEPLTISDLIRETSLPQNQLRELETLLRSKKQIILEGPPGSGKTYVARLFARYLAGLPLDGPVDEHVEIVQFHQSYGYEDFVAGIRPITNPDSGQLTYETRPGIFVEMCQRALAKPDETFVLIIDEINRGNLSRIFGELLYGLEYRDQPVRMQYPVSIDGSEQQHLTIPNNLYLIGTMNSTDRSLAMIDYALRRRFYFWRLMPVEGNDAPVLRRWLESRKEIEPTDRKRLLEAFIALNGSIGQLLGEDFQIGHSYFMLNDEQPGDPAAIEQVWRHAIEPLLREYFHTRHDAESHIDRMRAHFFARPTAPDEDFAES